MQSKPRPKHSKYPCTRPATSELRPPAWQDGCCRPEGAAEWYTKDLTCGEEDSDYSLFSRINPFHLPIKPKALLLNSILISHQKSTFRASVTKVLRRIALAACVLLLIQGLFLHPSLTDLHVSLFSGTVTVPFYESLLKPALKVLEIEWNSWCRELEN